MDGPGRWIGPSAGGEPGGVGVLGEIQLNNTATGVFGGGREPVMDRPWEVRPWDVWLSEERRPGSDMITSRRCRRNNWVLGFNKNQGLDQADRSWDSHKQ